MFDARKPVFDTTLARQIAKQHLSNFNNVFWVAEHSYKSIRQSFGSIRFPKPGPGVHGFFADEAGWQGAVDEFRVWTRQHVLISAASLLEVYVEGAATVALSSHPSLIDRAISIEGIEFLKHPERRPKHLEGLIKDRVNGFTHGLWKDRLLNLSLIFGALPQSLLDMTTQLQSIQDRRNRIAHSYGLGGELRRTPWQPIQAITVTPGQISDAIKIVSSAIRIMDESIFLSATGAYDLLHELDVWMKKNPDASRLDALGEVPGAFSKHVGDSFGRSPGRNYCKEMYEFYSRLR